MDKIILKGLNDSLEISNIALGCANYGTSVSDEIAFAQLDMYLEKGGNLLDTARVYGIWAEGGDGASEKALGRWLKARNCRDKVVIATKCSHPELSTMDISRLSKADIEKDLNESLSFMGTDYVDIMFLHRDDTSLPVSGIIDAIDEIIKSGKVRFFGVSNWSMKRINEANEYAAKNGKNGFVISQIRWSLASTNGHDNSASDMVEMDKIEYQEYLKNPMPVMCYTSQARGFFSKYLELGDEINQNLKNKFINDENLKAFEKAKEITQAKGYPISNVAVAALIQNKVAGIPIVSSTNMTQLEETLETSKVKLTDEEVECLWEGKY